MSPGFTLMSQLTLSYSHGRISAWKDELYTICLLIHHAYMLMLLIGTLFSFCSKSVNRPVYSFTQGIWLMSLTFGSPFSYIAASTKNKMVKDWLFQQAYSYSVMMGYLRDTNEADLAFWLRKGLCVFQCGPIGIRSTLLKKLGKVQFADILWYTQSLHHWMRRKEA